MDKNRSKHAYYIRIGWIQLGSLHYLSENRPFPERTLVYYDPQNLRGIRVQFKVKEQNYSHSGMEDHGQVERKKNTQEWKDGRNKNKEEQNTMDKNRS